MIHGQMLAAALVPPLATTLMFRFMVVVLFLSDYGFELAELIDGNVNEPGAEDAGLRFAGAFLVLGHVFDPSLFCGG